MRGATSPILYWDEWAFLKYNEIIYNAASPAQSKAQEMAAKMGRPYGKILTTTPNDLDVPEGAFAKKMIDEACPFDEAKYDWDREKLLKYIDANSNNDFIYIEFSYKQLGHDEDWFRKQCRNLNNDLRAIKREILLEWLLSSDTSPFMEEQLEAIQNNLVEPIGRLFIQDLYKFEFYDNLDPSIPYLLGVDVSGGLSRDDSAIVAVHPVSLKPVTVFKSNNVDTVELTQIIYELMTLYMPRSVAVIERNSYGKSVCDNLLRTDVASRLYYEYKETQAERKVSNGLVVKKKTKTKIYGVNTDKNSRDKMINEILRNIVNNEPEVVVSKYIYENIKNLERKKTGKIEHREGEKDDVLFAYLVVRYMVAFGSNSSRFVMVGGLDETGSPRVQTRSDVFMRGLNIISDLNKDPKNITNLSPLATSLIEEDFKRKILEEEIKDGETSFGSKMAKIFSFNNE